MTTLTPPPTAPSRSDAPDVFISRADALVAWFDTAVTEFNAAFAELATGVAPTGTVSAYMTTVLDDTTAAAARDTLVIPVDQTADTAFSGSVVAIDLGAASYRREIQIDEVLVSVGGASLQLLLSFDIGVSFINTGYFYSSMPTVAGVDTGGAGSNNASSIPLGGAYSASSFGAIHIRMTTDRSNRTVMRIESDYINNAGTFTTFSCGASISNAAGRPTHIALIPSSGTVTGRVAVGTQRGL